MSNKSKDFGQRLEQSIAEKEWTKSKFAEFHEISPSGLTDFLKGRVPDGITAIKFAKTLSKNPVWLLTGHDPTATGTEDHSIGERDGLFIPLAEGTISGGMGAIPSDDIKETVWIPKDFLGPTRGHECRYVAIEVSGNSMEPIIQRGEVVVIDRSLISFDQLKKRGVYAVRHEDNNHVKHLHFDKTKNTLQLISANPQWVRDYGFDSVNLKEEGNPIIGKVVFSYRGWK